jgi:hypothetical protein
VKVTYELYFGCKGGDQARAGHHIHVAGDVRGVYGTDSKALTSQFVFAVSMVWRKQKNNLTVCYFCLTKIDDHNSKSKHTIVYPNIPSSLDLLNLTIPYQFLNLNNRPCLKKNQPAPLQKMTPDLRVPLWILISQN